MTQPDPAASTGRSCPECGAPLRADTAEGLCGACLLGLAVGEPASVTQHPEQFGDYELIRFVSQGGMGIVYQARHLHLGRVVALKMVRPSLLESTTIMRRFQLEAQAVARLDHPNIVPIFDVGEFEGQCFFTMKFIEGGSLSKVMDSYRVPVPAAGRDRQETSGAALRKAQAKAAELIATLARAVHYAHEQGVIHRDIKPSNIMIGSDGRPYLMDFGVARVGGTDHSLTGTQDVLGTPSYMSPEQASSKPVSAASDVYSLGVVLYEMLTGRPPFRELMPLETLRRVVEDEPPSVLATNPRLARDLSIICSKCLEKEPLQRYASGLGLAEDLERYVRGEPILARRLGHGARLSRWVRRNPAGAALIGSLCLGLFLSLGLLQWVYLEKVKQSLLARQVQDDKDEISGLLHRAVDSVTEYLERIWADDDRRWVEIRSEEVAMLARSSVAQSRTRSDTPRYKLALLVEEHPVGRARQHALLIGHLEAAIAAALGRPVRIDLRLYKFITDYRNDLASGRIDLARMGIFPFLQAREQNPGLRPLVVPQSREKSVIFFSRAGSGIRSFEDLRGHSVAFGETNSTVSFRAQIELARRGISATNLSRFDFLDSALEFVEDVKAIGQEAALERIVYLHSHAQVIENVVQGRYDVGVAVEKAFEIQKHRGLEAIPGARFEKNPVVWVGSAQLDAAVVAAFQSAMLALKEETWVKKLPDHPAGFLPFRPESFALESEWFGRIRNLFPAKSSPARIPIPSAPTPSPASP